MYALLGDYDISASRSKNDMPIPKQDRAIITGLLLWVIAVTYPLLWMENSSVSEDGWSFIRLVSVAAIMYIVVCVTIFNKRILTYIHINSASDHLYLLYASFGLCVFILSIVNVHLISILYSAIYFYILCFMVLFWTSSERARHMFFGLAFLSSTVFLLVALIWHGLPQNRWIGGIHPNHYGAVAISVLVFSRLSGSKVYYLGVPLAFVSAYIVSSRYALAAILAFVMVDWFFGVRWQHVKLGIATVVVALGASVTALYGTSVVLENPIVEHAFDVKSDARGFGSGLTGRVDLWKEFYDQFVEKPILGYGFRYRDNYSGTHNGYLNLLLENGVVGGVLLLGALTLLFLKLWLASSGQVIARRRLRAGRRGRSLRPGILFSFVFSVYIAGFFQPQLISFGDVFGVLFFMAITSYIGLKRSRSVVEEG
jgi:O-antigen ligase